MATTCSACHGEGHVNCPQCDGRGREYDYMGDSYQCKNCQGSGIVKCGACDGKGKIY